MCHVKAGEGVWSPPPNYFRRHVTKIARTRERRTWADNKALATGVQGEIWEGITICEKNRATVFEFWPKGIQMLIDICHNWYQRKGVDACVFGIDNGTQIAYAVYVQDGFMRDISDEEDFTERRRPRRGTKATA
jgi:hypothetical protein